MSRLVVLAYRTSLALDASMTDIQQTRRNDGQSKIRIHARWHLTCRTLQRYEEKVYVVIAGKSLASLNMGRCLNTLPNRNEMSFNDNKKALGSRDGYLSG
eukprot:5537414-Pleurochrysis_carterae.AAC.4